MPDVMQKAEAEKPIGTGIQAAVGNARGAGPNDADTYPVGYNFQNSGMKGNSTSMKLVIQIIAVLVFVAGLVWFLQGVNILPGSYMTGDPQWAVNGAVAIVVSGAVFASVTRRK